ncbi:MAG TPA: hypothetical protein P5205_04675 [Candidatus Paceibacterota bacterium]|nr:hypothetical protein [Verrucomicrobiota bacterium]HSA09646.1 hypothetical protein [Candidatus Paceibacterota bacterium]
MQPPVISPPPPPPLEPERKPGPGRQLLVLLLSLCLGLFLADAVVSLVDDSLILLFDLHLLALLRVLVFLPTLLTTLVVYVLMGLTPMIPKRLFLPVTLFNPLAVVVLLPLATYYHGRFQEVAWITSLCQVALGLAIVWWAQGGPRLRWPLVAFGWLGARRFGWFNLSAFLLLNIFVLLPAVVAYLAVCTALSVAHFSEGFLTLRPGGLTVQARKYVREDGKVIHLVPMAHVGEAGFYHKLSQSFPTNAVVLMEGVTDNNSLLTNTITYQRMASSLGLAEQEKEFNPVQVQLVMADVDVEQFTTNTIGMLNLLMLIHAKGVNAETVLKLFRHSPPPHFEEELFDDLITKRNQRVLEEIHARLTDPEPIVVPWGVAHMPGVAEGIKASGFRVAETQDYTVMRFRFPGSASKSPGKQRGS